MHACMLDKQLNGRMDRAVCPLLSSLILFPLFYPDPVLQFNMLRMQRK